MWILARDEFITKPRRDIQTAQFMVRVMWNPLGFHMPDKLPTGARMNSALRSRSLPGSKQNVHRGKNFPCKKIDDSHGQPVNSRARSHETLCEAQQYDEAPIPAISTKLGAE
jgi:hypothetical protein